MSILSLPRALATAAYESRTARKMPGTPWQHGTGKHGISACLTRGLQRGSGCACLRVLLILHEVRPMCTIRHPCRGSRYSGRETPCAIDS